jgi:predicted nucleic acid-binding protein
VIGRSAQERSAFVDSSAFLATIDRRDANRADALGLLHKLATGRYRQITTNAIVFECHALVLARMGRDVAEQFLDGLDESATTIVRVTEDDERAAREIIRRYRDKAFSFTDALSFTVIERLGIRYAFTYDRHFAQYGLAVIQSSTDLE